MEKDENNESDLRPLPEAFKKVRKELENLGFNIISQGEYSFTIFSDKNHFEDIFGIKLSQKQFPLFETKAQPTVKLYFTEELIRIPESLKDLVDRITLPKSPYPTSKKINTRFEDNI